MAGETEPEGTSGQDEPTLEAIPDKIAEMVNVREEDDQIVVRAAAEAGAAFLCVIGPYAAMRVSPVEEIRPHIGLLDEFGVEVAISHVQAGTSPNTPVYLLVNSMGGTLSASYKVARALVKAFPGRMTSFVPHIAASGGTIIAIAGKPIVMGSMSQLSPTDAQQYYKGAMVSCTTALRLFKRTSGWFEKKTEDEVPYPQRALADKLDPLIMEEWSGAIAMSVGYVSDILELGSYAKEEAEQIAQMLVGGFHTHEQVITPDTARQIGLDVADPENHARAWEVMRYWLARYVSRETPTHFFRYALPPQGAKPAAEVSKDDA